MTDLAELAADLFPGSMVLGRTSAGMPRPIAWVRVMRGRVPAFDALEPGDLVIAPQSALAVVAPGPDELHDLVTALTLVPVSGVVLPHADGRGDRGDDEPASMIAAAGLPVVSLPHGNPAELERTVVGYIVARGAELERQAALLEGELRRRALEGGDAATLLAAFATFLGRAVALEGGRGRPMAVHVPADAPAAAADAARYQASAGRGAQHAQERERAGHRVALPNVDVASQPGGAEAIVILGATPLSELARVTLPRVAALLALELARDEAVRGAADRARRAESMPSAGPPWVVAFARQRVPGVEEDAPAARESREATRRALRLFAPARRMSLRGDADSLEVRIVLAVDPPGGADPEGRGAAGAIAELLGRTVAVSRPFGTPGDRPAAEGQARAALDVADSLPDSGQVVVASRLPVYRMLGALHHVVDGPALARAVLEPLLASRPDVRREHLATLRTYLDRGGVGEAATALGIHRNTATYRLRRIEAMTGWDLSDPDLRLALSLALRFVHDL